jgi:transcriptional regulator with XRE-family HTH domain
MIELNQAIAQMFIRFRRAAKLSQAELADLAGVHRTYISQMERALKMPTLATLFKICAALKVEPSLVVTEIENTLTQTKSENTYIIKTEKQIDCGFRVIPDDVARAIQETNRFLSTLPFSLYLSVDYKTISSIIGAVFCEKLALIVGAMVNPIEKGHPDIVPITAIGSSEAQLRNYPKGLEIKCTVGNIKIGANLQVGQTRIADLTGITWQAHHQEVTALLGLVWDFIAEDQVMSYPQITGAFYSDQLTSTDWGAISGTTGRNTKVTGMSGTGKAKMGAGWMVLLSKPEYLKRYKQLLKFELT